MSKASLVATTAFLVLVPAGAATAEWSAQGQTGTAKSQARPLLAATDLGVSCSYDHKTNTTTVTVTFTKANTAFGVEQSASKNGGVALSGPITAGTGNTFTVRDSYPQSNNTTVPAAASNAVRYTITTRVGAWSVGTTTASKYQTRVSGNTCSLVVTN